MATVVYMTTQADQDLSREIVGHFSQLKSKIAQLSTAAQQALVSDALARDLRDGEATVFRLQRTGVTGYQPEQTAAIVTGWTRFIRYDTPTPNVS